MLRRLPDRLETRTLLLAFLASLAAIQAMRAFFAGVYYHNLTALGLNRTALAVLLLASPILLARARDGSARLWLVGSAVALAGARLVMAAAPTSVAHLVAGGVTAAAFLVLLPAFLVLARERMGAPGARLVALGLALAWAADAGLRLVLNSSDPSTARWGWVLVIPETLALAWLALGWPERSAPGAAAPPPVPFLRALPLAAAGAALGSWLYLENVLVGSPYSIMRWSETPLWHASLAVLLGLLAPVLYAMSGRSVHRGALVVLHALGLVGVLDHTTLHSPLVPLLLGFAQAALVLDLVIVAGSLSRAPLRHAGLATLLGTLTLLALHFATAFSFTFAYVPLGHLWQGQEHTIALVAFLLLPLAAFLANRGRFEAAPVPVPRRLALALVALILLLPGIGLADAPAAVPTPPDGEPLRIATLNVHQGFNNDGRLDPDLFVQLVRSLDADVVALQESDTPRFTSGNLDINAILAHALGYHHYDGPPTSEQSVGVSILSRFPITEASYHRLPTFTDNRFYIAAKLDVHGRDLWVYANHFGLPTEDRMAQATALLEAVEGQAPRVLIGDFNSCPSGRCPTDEAPDDVYARLTANHTDAWTALGHPRDDPRGHTYDALMPAQRIDYIFLSDELNVVAVERVRDALAVRASDHLPVVAEVEWRR